jgi:hypothetical protein
MSAAGMCTAEQVMRSLTTRLFRKHAREMFKRKKMTQMSKSDQRFSFARMPFISVYANNNFVAQKTQIFLLAVFCLHQMKEILRCRDLLCVFSMQEEDTSDRMEDQTKSISL